MGQIVSARLTVPSAWLTSRHGPDRNEDDDLGGGPDFGVRQPVWRGPTAMSGSIAVEEPEELDLVEARSAAALVRR